MYSVKYDLFLLGQFQYTFKFFSSFIIDSKILLGSQVSEMNY
jgi:hypothetical protein